MKLTINTETLKTLLTKAVRGCSNNKLIPITSMICISAVGKKVQLVTTDATNYLYVSGEALKEESDFYVTIQVDTFSKLIQKMTCENVSLEIKDGVLVVSGNGTYKIELPLDENGNPVKFPDPVKDLDYHDVEATITKPIIDSIINTAKSALATTLEVPCYTGYYMGDKVITTDTYKICGMDIDIFNVPKLLSSEAVDLLTVMTDNDVNIYEHDNNVLVFADSGEVLYTKEMAGIEDFQVEAITELLESEFDSVCKFPKSSIIPMLDRLSLFVGTYDKGAVILTFTKDGLMVSSKADSGQEIIPYTDIENFKEFTCLVDVEMLQSQIKAQVGDMVTLYYGKENAIKMVDGNVTQIIALLED